MKRISGWDAAYLYLETAEQSFVVDAVLDLDPSGIPGGYSFDRLSRELGRRLRAVPALRRTLADSAANLGHPAWVEAFDLEPADHIHRHDVPYPGDRAAVLDLAGDLCSRRLDLGRPLWEVHVLEGAADGSLPVLVRFHHMVMDGLSATRLLDRLCDGPDGAAPSDPEAMRTHAGGRHDLALVAGGAVHFLSRPVTLARLLPETLAIPVRLAGGAVTGLLRHPTRGEAPTHGDVPNRDDGPGPEGRDRAPAPRTPAPARALPFTAPRTPFNAAITPSRSVGTISLDFDDVTTVRRAFDATVNEVLLAIAGGGLRHYLEQIDAVPDRPLISVVPVAIRDGGGRSAAENKVSARFVSLATDIEDPAGRLRAIRASRPATAAPRRRPVARASLLADWMELGFGPVLRAGMRVYGGWGLADLGPVVHNLVISNVPGPTERRSLAGAAVTGFAPLAPVYPGAGLSLAAVSYAGRLHVGVLACRHLVPDPQEVADGIGRALEELVAAVPAS